MVGVRWKEGETISPPIVTHFQWKTRWTGGSVGERAARAALTAARASEVTRGEGGERNDVLRMRVGSCPVLLCLGLSLGLADVLPGTDGPQLPQLGSQWPPRPARRLSQPVGFELLWCGYAEEDGVAWKVAGGRGGRARGAPPPCMRWLAGSRVGETRRLTSFNKAL